MTKPSYKRSGGPQTPEGKLAVSKNALKTGAYSSALLLPGESEADFQELYESLLIELQADGVLESTLVRELAVLTWKRLRLEQIEHKVLLARLEAPVSSSELEELGLATTPELQEALKMASLLNQTDLESAKADASAVLKILDKANRTHEIAKIKANQPELYTKLSQIVLNEALLDKIAGSVDVMTRLYSTRSFAREQELNKFIETMAEPLCAYLQGRVKEIEFALQQSELIESSRQQIRDLRISKFMLAEGPSRAKDDLSRNFYRTLKELRTQQLWRKQNQIIDVTPA